MPCATTECRAPQSAEAARYQWFVEEALRHLNEGDLFELDSDVVIERNDAMLEVGWSQPDMRDPRNHWLLSRMLERLDLVRLGRYSHICFQIPLEAAEQQMRERLTAIIQLFLDRSADPERLAHPLKSRAFQQMLEWGRLRSAENCSGLRVILPGAKLTRDTVITNCDSIEIDSAE